MFAVRSMTRSFRQVNLADRQVIPRLVNIQVHSFCSNYNNYEFDIVTDTELPANDGNTTEKPRKKGMNSNYRFIDKCNIEVKGGKGGAGCISYERPVPGVKIPSGGNGGGGGNVYIVADSSMTSLSLQVSHFNAENGGNGGGSAMTGRKGKDLYVKVPVGTIVKEKPIDYVLDGDEYSYVDFEDVPDEEIDEDDEDVYVPPNALRQGDDSASLVETEGFTVTLDAPGTTVLVAEGGRPGLGSKAMASAAKKGKYRSQTDHSVPGFTGEQRQLVLELKLIADVGLVGLPNAGKSSLLRAMSNAKPKIAPYPFTTLHPNIGVIEYSDFGTISMADIPGLIEGAHDNKGLGFDFLKHIERTKVLLYVLDGSSFDSTRTPAEDLRALLNELELYSKKLVKKPSLVFINKTDVEGKTALHKAARKVAKKHGLEVLEGSARTSHGVGELAEKLRQMLIEK